jgi:aminopeptidase N
VYLEIASTPRVTSRNRQLGALSSEILKFYAQQFGEAPYPNLTVVAADALLPGGHSPAFFALIQQPLPNTPLTWREDPLAFDRYPNYLISHEIAHQWWGQAVGFKNYHEQWLSEGLAQYSSVMYLSTARPDVLRPLIREMRNSALSMMNKGPIWLGYRLGHIEGRGAVFRAIVYNKSAVVLHMLRRLIGDEAFSRGLQRFYRQWRFQKAGTDDLRAAFETEAARPLGRFFDRWIFGSTVPKLRVTSHVDSASRSALVRVEQVGETFDLPLTIGVEYTDGRTVEVSLAVTEQVVELRISLAGEVRKIWP